MALKNPASRAINPLCSPQNDAAFVIRTLLILAISLAAHSAAGDVSLHQPIDCTLGSTCYIQQYVDADPGPGATDHTCGTLSYNTHKGTDFALPSLAAMQAGVNVLATASGSVLGIRDNMPDTGLTDATAGTVKGRECGNGVMIEHGDGWVTQYCHMKRGSITVRPDQIVSPGTILGQVALVVPVNSPMCTCPCATMTAS